MEVSFKFKNSAQLKRALAEAPREMAVATQTAIVESARLVRDTSKELIRSGYPRSPYASGQMYRLTQMFFPRPFYAEIIPQVSYAIYPHEGRSTSRKYGRRPFIEDSLKKNQKAMEKKMLKAMNAVLNNFARKV